MLTLALSLSPSRCYFSSLPFRCISMTLYGNFMKRHSPFWWPSTKRLSPSLSPPPSVPASPLRTGNNFRVGTVDFVNIIFIIRGAYTHTHTLVVYIEDACYVAFIANSSGCIPQREQDYHATAISRIDVNRFCVRDRIERLRNHERGIIQIRGNTLSAPSPALPCPLGRISKR